MTWFASHPRMPRARWASSIWAMLVAAALVLAATPTGAATKETLILPIGKAHVVNLPANASDVLVSSPSIVDTVLRTARQPVLFGVSIGQANVLFFDERGNQMRSIDVRVEYDTAMLDRLIRQQFPKATVATESVFGEIVLSGQVRTSRESADIASLAERFIQAARSSQSAGGADGGAQVETASAEGASGGGVVNRLSVINEEQILLRVRVAEVNRTVLKRLGIDWNAGLQASTLSTTIGFTGRTLQGFLQNYTISQLVNLDGSVVDNDGDGVQDIVFQQRRPIQVGPETLDSFIKALEQYTLLRTLAEPSLTAISGEAASFLAGGEFPVPIATDEDTINVEFKQFGVGLDFTPVVIGDGRISLSVATEVSDLSDRGAVSIAGLTIPALTVRRADTTVELSSGGTIMIAGLIQQTTRRLSIGLPGLRQVPVLGQLFRSEEFQNDETELVILVTPYAVRQGQLDDFRLPTDGFAPASDVDMYLFGRLHSVYGAGDAPNSSAAAQTTAQALRAPVGFIME